jgi:hypothetical protein
MSLPESIERFSNEFDAMCMERHEKGSEKYGPGKFLTVDTLEEALFELADLSNYARYTFVRVKLLQQKLTETQAMTADFSEELQ